MQGEFDIGMPSKADCHLQHRSLEVEYTYGEGKRLTGLTTGNAVINLDWYMSLVGHNRNVLEAGFNRDR